MRPLDGITVVSLEQAVAAPFATRQLADLGARVIKIERPGSGDFARAYDKTVHGQGSYFVWLNRTKESVTLDLKTEAGQRILHELLADADVFVQNLAPGATRRQGLDAETLAARYPQLIVCDITGFGSTGPWADRKAYDLLVQFETGLVSITGTPDEVAKVGISVADISAGMNTYSGILTALYTRATTGKAPAIEVSLFESLAEWMGQPAYYTQYGGSQPLRAGAAHATIAPYGPYPIGDGGTVLLSIQHDREWRAFCGTVLGDPELADDDRFANNAVRVINRDALDKVIVARLAELDTATTRALLDSAGIANAKLNTVAEFLAHPVLAGRDRWRTIAQPRGDIQALLPPATLAGVDIAMGPVPDLGEHTDAVLAGLGYDDQNIAALRADGVI
ncbi:formyl-CoA transferase [Sinosporangium album]|uniref:Formyl-CoA transferase n=1 Tax=Sinosporangium album TaxID=504805 RepID=A0A1G8FQD4_9ACTN|nr:CaiB/BaiF CoA-transferase family protein [Sinosporangium album]SDH84372.1 formyl-CoA transferase [Sinosporangium album]